LANETLAPEDKKRLMENFTGYDISPDMVRLSLVNLYLHSFPSPKVYEYDTLTSDDRWEESYNIILANPPFMTPKGGIRPHNRFSVQGRWCINNDKVKNPLPQKLRAQLSLFERKWAFLEPS
jgi:type I restriction enzyme M protein